MRYSTTSVFPPEQFLEPQFINDVEYNDIVPKKYRMDPHNEKMIFGSDLKEGMIVLCPEQLTWETQVDFENILVVKNRWCEVLDARFDIITGDVSFIGRYSDQRCSIRSSKPLNGWLVKKPSMPDAAPDRPTLVESTDEVKG